MLEATKPVIIDQLHYSTQQRSVAIQRGEQRSTCLTQGDTIMPGPRNPSTPYSAGSTLFERMQRSVDTLDLPPSAAVRHRVRAQREA